MSESKGPAERAESGRVGPPEGASDAPEGFQAKERSRRTAHTTREPMKPAREYTGEERLLLLDTWQRSELPATEFSVDSRDCRAGGDGFVVQTG